MFATMLWLAGCAVHVAEVAAPVPQAAARSDWDRWVDEPGPLTVETFVSARWTVPLHGLVDLDDPAAASLEDGPHAIVLPVTVIHHPLRGTFVVDTGVDQDLAGGGHGGARGVVRSFLGKMEPVESLDSIVRRSGGPLAGVLLTHTHLDHVLGLPDVPAGTPIYTGPGELQSHDFTTWVMRPTYQRLLEGVTLSVLDPALSVPLGGFSGWDLLGDGSLWALSTPGHTPGSLSFLARTPEGPVLMVGDSSHTRWGWDHNVPPGTYSEDPAQGAESLRKLEAFAASHPGMKVLVGHEL